MATTNAQQSATKRRSHAARSSNSKNSGAQRNRAPEAHTPRVAGEEQFEAAAERIRDLNERIIDSAKKAGGVYLDAYEKTLNSIADYEERFANQTDVDWVGTIVQAQASFTRDLAGAYSSAARSLLK